MPIDPQVRVFLDQLKGLRAPPLHTLTPEQAAAAVATAATFDRARAAIDEIAGEFRQAFA